MKRSNYTKLLFRGFFTWSGTSIKKDTDFEKAVGKFIYVKTYKPIKDMKEFLGYLTSYDEHTLVMEVRIKTRKMTVTIEQEKIALARLAIDFSA